MVGTADFDIRFDTDSCISVDKHTYTNVFLNLKRNSPINRKRVKKVT